MRLFSNFTKAQKAFLQSIRDNESGPERFPKPGTLNSWLENPKFKETYEMLQRDIQREIDLRMLLLQRQTARTLTTPQTPLPTPAHPANDLPSPATPQTPPSNPIPQTTNHRPPTTDKHPPATINQQEATSTSLPSTRNQSIKEYRLCLAHQRQNQKSAPKPAPPPLTQEQLDDLDNDQVEAEYQKLRNPEI